MQSRTRKSPATKSVSWPITESATSLTGHFLHLHMILHQIIALCSDVTLSSAELSKAQHIW